MRATTRLGALDAPGTRAASLPGVLAILALAAPALGVRVSRAESDVDGMLRRARSGLPAVPGDRELAGDLLMQWRESEAVSPQPGDQALGRALESASVGRRLAPDEAAAVERYEETRRRSRMEAAEGSSGTHPGDARGPGAGRPLGRRSILRAPALWIAGGAGALVLAGGVLWIVLSGRLRRR